LNTHSTTQSGTAGGGRHDESALQQILDKLDARMKPAPSGKSRRTSERYTYRRMIQVELRQPSGLATAAKVLSRDLSRTGLSFLYKSYHHVGTTAVAQLVTIHNNWQQVEGTVTRCQYVEGGWHLVSLRFHHPVDVAMFTMSAMTHRVLLVDDDAAMRRIVNHHLSGLHAEVTLAENGEEALQKAGAQSFDCILLDIDMPVLDGISAMKRLRESGYRGVIVACTARTGAGDCQALLKLGFDRYLAKPIAREALAAVMQTLDEEPLFSSLSGQPGMKELIDEFLASLPAHVQELEKAVAGKDLTELVRVARLLKGEAGSFGFDAITQVAQKLEDLARAPAALTDLEREVRDLTKLCRAARPSSS
jgi:CheY-like chemotaxis protein